MLNDYTNKAVLITGGTKGIGLATGLAFGRQGAHVYLTHRWGSADEDAVRAQFARAGAPEPVIVEADASVPRETKALVGRIAEEHARLEVLVSNVCVVPVTEGIDSLTKRGLFKSLEYSTWPMVDYLERAHEALGAYPRYVIGVSSDGPDQYYQGYDYVAVAKVVMEVLTRYLSSHLLDEDIRLNVVRTRNVITESALAVHGQDYPEFVRTYGGENHFIETGEVADAILALCSGLLDAMSGQIVTVDRGGTASDNLMRLYHRREEWGL